MTFYLCGYTGSGNHSDEDRIRGSCRLMSAPPDVISTNPEEEFRYGIAYLAGIFDRLPMLTAEACCLTHRPEAADTLRAAGGRPVLWGWSGATFSRQLVKNLAKFDTLVVSEAQSATALHAAGFAKKTRLGPDLSFLVERRYRPLQGNFQTDTVGLCLSMPEGQGHLLYRSYQHLLRYILRETDLQAALIPYCVRKGRDDTLLHRALAQSRLGCHRLVCRPDGNCQELRGDISLCRWVVGCEGAVAAWSCGIPALCIGATPRAIGLAKELFGSWEDAVVPLSSLRDSDELTRRFRKFLHRADKLRQELEITVPLRRQQALDWKW